MEQNELHRRVSEALATEGKISAAIKKIWPANGIDWNDVCNAFCEVGPEYGETEESMMQAIQAYLLGEDDDDSEESESPYPNEIDLKIVDSDHSTLKIGDSAVTLSIIARADEPEASDIIQVAKGNDSFFVHPFALSESALKGKGKFLNEIDQGTLAEALGRSPIRCNTVDDSRDYFEIEVSGQKIELSGHYMGMSLYPMVLGGQLSLIVAELFDSEHRKVPRFCLPLESDRLLINSARFDEDDQMWEYIDPDDLDGSKAEESLQELIDQIKKAKSQQDEAGNS